MKNLMHITLSYVTNIFYVAGLGKYASDRFCIYSPKLFLKPCHASS